MQSFPIAAIADSAELMRPRDKAWREYKIRLGHLNYETFFNAGVMLIDRKLYGEQKICERVLDFLASCSHKDCLDDQSALNAVLKNNWLELSPIFNWTITNRFWLLKEFDPILIHYVGRSKPWCDYKNRAPASYKADMKQFYNSIGMGSAFVSYSLFHRFSMAAKNWVMHGVDLLGLDRRAQSIRRFMNPFRPSNVVRSMKNLSYEVDHLS
jgi:lipopolysaccharide biosynthesis glycosyltransferase